MARACFKGTPLYTAAYSKYILTVELLLQFRANPRAKMEIGETLLVKVTNDKVKKILLKLALKAGI